VIEFVPLLVPIGYLALVAFKLSSIDFAEHRLPNHYTLRLFLLSTPAVFIAAIISLDWQRLSVAWLAALVTAGSGLLLVLGGGFGMGDVKLLVSLNLLLGYLSPWLVLISNLTSVLTAALAGFGKLLLGKSSVRDSIAFGPFLIASFFLATVIGLFSRVY
jgi:leader peptidase (prepilin peptidase)/N-methyltransferase